MKKLTLNNGVEIPCIGLGIYNIKDQKEMSSAIEYALDAGYRSFDTAQMYENEDLIGEALASLDVKREYYFLTTKINLPNMSYEKVLSSFEESLVKLQTDYVDMLMIHWPGQQKARLQDAWKALEYLYTNKKVKAIGVCNCEIKHLEWILETAEVVPAVNQVERNPFMNDEKLRAWCVAKGITMEAWSPLSRGNLQHPEILRMSEKYKKTPAQVVLGWDMQSGYIAIPKSVHKERIEENMNIFDFKIDDEDLKILDNLNESKRMSHDPVTFDY